MSISSIKIGNQGWIPSWIPSPSTYLFQGITQIFEWANRNNTYFDTNLIDKIKDTSSHKPIETLRKIERAGLMLHMRTAHVIRDPKLIIDLLHCPRGGELLDAGFAADIDPLIKSDTMLLCPFAEHKRLRTPLDKPFQKKQMLSQESLLAQVKLGIDFFVKDDSGSVIFEPLLYVSKTIFHVLGVDLSADRLLKIDIRNNDELRSTIKEILLEKKFFDDGLVALVAQTDQLSEEEKISEIILIIEAGIDTTTSLIRHLCDYIIRTGYAEKIFDEWNTFLDGREITVETEAFPSALNEFIASNDFLQTCYLESLRLFPTIPNLKRIAKKDFTLGTFQIHAGDELHLNIAAAQRDPQTWGENSHQFDPSHFEAIIREKRHHNLLAFGLGSQSCLGKYLAEKEVKTFAALMFILYTPTRARRGTGTDLDYTGFTLRNFNYDNYQFILKSLLDPLSLAVLKNSREVKEIS